MSQDQTWRSAESQDELIHDLTEGAIRKLGDDDDLIEIYGQSEYAEELADRYSPKRVYGNPFDDVTFFSCEDKPIPEKTAQCIKKSDTLYEGIAKAAKAGLNEFARRKNLFC